ncbi:polysaccharide deacetylase [Variovorax sp. J31P207]|uniref:polysaccharide deacetylase family protein n=1 Tax=Variovorax sp. J31P207 TaxID=3053510 RepID=UPI0025750A16|nr:polysaccharide deacetylase [Variovorax sp. J31P207]MDM0071615.1 polysaccharide deacetylase [Variovorax sp. J31P207]
MADDYTTRIPAAANRAPPAPEFPWPEGHRCALMPAFDVDGESVWLAFDALSERRLVSRSYGGYEARVGIPKILEALAQRQIKATFFVTGWALDAHPALCESIVKSGHEVAHHGYWHQRPEPGQVELMREELEKGLDAMKRVLGVTPVGYRAPYGENVAELLAMLAERSFLYSSSWRDDIRPYRHLLDNGEAGPIEIPVNFSFDDWGYGLTHRHSPRTLMPRGHVMSIWKDEMDQTREWGGVVSMVMHPQVSGRPKGYMIMTEFLDYALSQKDIWIATGEQIARHHAACEQMARST